MLRPLIRIFTRSLATAPTAPKNRNIPSLPIPDDLIETFIRGGGKGGQSINKTSSCVALMHKESKIRVVCQATRSREQNRIIARKLMALKLDHYQLQQTEGGMEVGRSRLETQYDRARAKKASRKRKGRRLREGIAGEVENEDSQ